MQYTTYTGASYDLYPSLLQHVDVTIYNGDVDACVPYNSNADWVEALAKQQGYAQAQAWRPCHYPLLRGCLSGSPRACPCPSVAPTPSAPPWSVLVPPLQPLH